MTNPNGKVQLVLQGDLWICTNCDTIMELDVHGRCSTCASEAIMRYAGCSTRLVVDPVEELIARFEKYHADFYAHTNSQ